ncbi:MAG: hypothetical protein VX768_04655 [Planctomycetota bacterium]|nr:hypothetical protein [Planctomycetota bacterium]
MHALIFLICVSNSRLCQEPDEDARLRALWQQAQVLIVQENHLQTEKGLSEVIKKKADYRTALYWRGRVRFQLGEIMGSISDFNRYVEFHPEARSRQWERGISLYYGGQFKEGAKQFEIYQTYHDNDVENSAWRFLCVARTEGLAAARKNLLPIRNDRRIPMMQIYQMYQDKLTPEKVLKAAEELPETEGEKNSARFYAHLYVGLLYEVQGKMKESLQQIKDAENHRIPHYMWDVARVHRQLRSGTAGSSSKKGQSKNGGRIQK